MRELAVKDAVIDHQFAHLRHAGALGSRGPNVDEFLSGETLFLDTRSVGVGHFIQDLWIAERWIAISNHRQAIAVANEPRGEFPVGAQYPQCGCRGEHLHVAGWRHQPRAADVSNRRAGTDLAHAHADGGFLESAGIHGGLDGRAQRCRRLRPPRCTFERSARGKGEGSSAQRSGSDQYND